MKFNLKKRVLLRIIAIGLAIAILLILINKQSRVDWKNNIFFKEKIKYSKEVYPSDVWMFKKLYHDKLVGISKITSNMRGPTISCIYSDSFIVSVISLDTANNLNLSDVKFENFPLKKSSQVTYRYHQTENRLFYEYNMKASSNIRQLIINLNADSVAKIVSDSVLYINALQESLAIKYGEKQPVDFLMDKRSFFYTSQKLPISILLLKKNRFLFLILMISETDKIPLPKELLWKIVDL